MCHWFDGIMNLNGILMDAAIYFYIANETISIIENLGRIDVLIPEQLKQIITVLRNKNQK
ncbi:phage holin family protein [Paenibacillus sp. HGF7]